MDISRQDKLTGHNVPACTIALRYWLHMPQPVCRGSSPITQTTGGSHDDSGKLLQLLKHGGVVAFVVAQ